MTLNRAIDDERLRVVLAALELYEFSGKQLVNYAGVTQADFDDATRKNGILELEKVIVKCRETMSGHRKVDVYTFRNPYEFEELRHWVSQYRLQDAVNELELSPESNVPDEDIEHILWFLGSHAKSRATYLELSDEEMDNRLREESLIWVTRGFNYLTRWIESNGGSDFFEPEAQRNDTQYIKYQLYRFRFRYFSALNNSDNAIGKLKILFEDLLGLLYRYTEYTFVIYHYGFVGIGLSIIDSLSSLHYQQFRSAKKLAELSDTWERGKWEEVSRWFDVCFVKERNLPQPVVWLETYWSEKYQKILDSIDKENEKVSSLGILFKIPSLRDELLEMLSGNELDQLLRKK